MLSLFKKKKDDPGAIGRDHSNPLTPAFEKTALKISAWLNRKTVACSTRQKKIGLAAFCVFFGGISIYLLASAFLPGDQPKPGPVKTQVLSRQDSLKSREMMSSRMFENLKQLKLIYQQKSK